MKLSILIPVYNEKNTIEKLIQKVKSVNISKEIIIIDDGSIDGTRDILKNLKDSEIKVILQDKNQGKGFCIRTGIKYVTGDIVAIQDADLEYDPHDFIDIIKPIMEGETKIVYGTRFPKNKKRPSIFKNKFYLANKILTITANILYDARITDEATCYKIFDSEVIKSIDLTCKRFEFCPEVTAKARKKGYKITELPISYYPRSENEGKKIKYRDGFEALWTLIKFRFVK